jgi:urease accessory protein
MLDLSEVRVLVEGDALVLASGLVVVVEAMPEPLLEIRAHDVAHLARLAWHIGNRHVAAELNAERILIRDDDVLADMLRGLGAVVTPVTAPFNPEHGAYHSHGPSDEHQHEHGHAHPHMHDHSHGHSHRSHPRAPP